MAHLKDLIVNGASRFIGKAYGAFVGSFTGNLDGNAATTTKVTATATGANAVELVRADIADNDYFRIIAGGTGSNAGYAAIDTADDGTEPIYVRQWTGVFATCARTATLLDSSGNTSFPGTLTASKVYNAVYNDYAEFFEKEEDIVFEAGDIVALDMDTKEERYVKATEDSAVIVGVCTHEYAHIIGGKKQSLEENEKEFVPVSLMGRVHVKVDDTVKRGDKVTASKVPGIGRKAMPGEHSIGTALTNPSNGKVRVLINL